MDKLTQKLLKTFLISGTAFFALLGITFIAVQIWPVIWDEWSAYKKGDDLTSAKITNIRILKNDYYSQTFLILLKKNLWIYGMKNELKTTCFRQTEQEIII